MNIKKIIFLITIILFISIIGYLKPINVKAQTYTDQLYLDNSFTFAIATTTIADHSIWVYDDEKLLRRASDNKPVYCLQAHVLVTNGAGIVGFDDDASQSTLLNLSFADRLRVFQIAYFGYGYGNHTSLDWYAATQIMIWQITDRYDNPPYPVADGDFSLTYSNRYDSMFNEINYLVDHASQTVSFNNQTVTANIGDTITITDTNGMLSSFFDVSANGLAVTKNGNTLTIKSNSAYNGNITLTPKTGNKPIIYDGANQKLLSRGDPYTTRANLKVVFTSGDIEIQKVDKDTGLSVAQGEATLKGAVYDIYRADNNQLVGTITTDINGKAKSGSILNTLTRYYVVERQNSNGYLLDNTKYYFEITKGNIHAKVTVYEKIAENYISILKQYNYVNGNTTFLNAESNIEFEIFNNNNELIKTIKTDQNGYASTTLPYGVYKFHQKNSNTGFEKIYDFYITVDYNSNNEQYYNILNNKLSAYLQVIKVDEETGQTIAMSDTTFKIFNKNTNQYVSQYVGGKVISDFKTDDTGTFITPLKLEASDYKLIEVSNPSGYIINDTGIDFTIGGGTNYTYTTYGAITSVQYSNRAIKGQIIIKKDGEIFSIENGTFNYDETVPLENVTYNIYANEDIKTPDGNHLYYYKDDLVATLSTNSLGMAESELLPLGKYTIVEISNENTDYIIDPSKYDVELSEIDNRTPIVYKTINLTNKLKKGALLFTKIDYVNGEPIANTKIEIFTENGDLVYSGLTDKKGEIEIKELRSGVYYITETIANDNYIRSDEIIYFEIKENGEIVKAEMKNKPITGTLEITKLDISTEEPIENVLFEIYDISNNLIYSKYTDKNGKIKIENLRKGRYYFIEKSVKQPYKINTDKHWFEIKDNDDVIKSTVYNEKNIEVPDTATTNITLIDVIGFVALILGIGYLIYDKKKK